MFWLSVTYWRDYSGQAIGNVLTRPLEPDSNLTEVHCRSDLRRFLAFFSSSFARRMSKWQQQTFKETSPVNTVRYRTNQCLQHEHAAPHTSSKNTRPQNKLKKRLFYCDIYDIEPLLIGMAVGTPDTLHNVMV